MGIGVAAVATIATITLQGSILDFIDAGSVFIVIVGTLGALIANYPIDDIKKLMQLVKIAMKKSDFDYNKQINELVEMANIARKNGLLALEEKTKTMTDTFMQKGLMMILDGTDPELIKNVLEAAVYTLDERHSWFQGMFLKAASVAPAFGMLGTVIALVAMLKELDDPSKLGPGMSLAMVTTFYGVICAHVIFTPLANQLKRKSMQEQFQKDFIIEGLLSIQDGENPRIIKEKLQILISNSDIKDDVSEKADSSEGR